jgi:Putative peptidoglycan binding domain
MRCSAALAVTASILCLLLSSCAENLPQDIPKDYTAPNEHIFTVPFDKAWKETVQAVSEESMVKTLDRDSGLIVTEYVTINKRVLNMFETAMFGRTYKNSYSITLNELSPGKTTIRVQSNLMMEQFAIYNRERQVQWFEAYMRQDVFRRICQALYKDAGKCTALFPEYNSASCPPAGEGVAKVVETTPPPQLPATSTVVADASVRAVQKALQERGYQPGLVDGVLGKRTRAALLRFQEDNALEGGGYLTEATLRALGL